MTSLESEGEGGGHCMLQPCRDRTSGLRDSGEVEGCERARPCGGDVSAPLAASVG